MTENEVTDRQREMLLILFLLQGDDDVSLAGSALAFWLGGKWTTYRHHAMLKLERYGYVEAHKIPMGVESKAWRWFYHLTSESREEMRRMQSDSKIHRIFYHHKQLSLPLVTNHE